MTAYANILVETQGAVGILTLNRPSALNALSVALMTELGQALDAFAADAAIGAIVVTGAGKAFAAGADVTEMSEARFVELYLSDFPRLGGSGWASLAACRKPIVAAVSGLALGGGCELALACDFILAADDAKFAQPEIALGIMPGAGGTQRLVRAVGKAKAMEMCLTGRRIDAIEAERAGLVSRVVPRADLRDEAVATAARIATRSRLAVMMIKESVNGAFETSLAEGLRLERRAFQSTFATEDCREGMAAFAEKRSPRFKNR